MTWTIRRFPDDPAATHGKFIHAGGDPSLYWAERKLGNQIVQIVADRAVQLPFPLLRPNDPLITVVERAGIVCAVGFDGSAYEWNDGVWIRTVEPPAGFEPRLGAAFAWDGHALYVAGGRSLGNRAVSGVFRLADRSWSKLAAKGAKISEAQAVAAWDARLERLVLAGGRQTLFGQPTDEVWEISAERARSFPSTPGRALEASHDASPTSLAFDPVSERVFGLGSGARSPLWSYVGDGQWELAAADLPEPADPAEYIRSSPAQFDRKTRELVVLLEKAEFVRGSALLRERAEARLAIGHWLDALPKRPVAVTAPGRPRTAAALPSRGRPAFDLVARGGVVSNDLLSPSWKPRGPCRVCGKPQTPVVLLRADPARLPLRKHAGLLVLWCTSGLCEDAGQERSGANEVRLLQASELEELEELEGKRVRYRARLEPDPTDGQPPKIGDKLGGYPSWFNREPEPFTCETCGSELRFVGEFQLSGGYAYVFVCSDEHEGIFFWETT